MLFNNALLQLLDGLKGIVATRSGVATIGQLFAIFRAYIVALLVNSVLQSTITENYRYIVLFIVCLLIEGGIHYLNTLLEVKCGSKIKTVLRSKLTKKILEFGPSYVDKNRSGQLSTILVDKIEALDPYYSTYIPNLISTIIVATLVIGYLCTIDFYVAMICLFGIAIVLLVPTLWFKLMYKRGQEEWQLRAEFNSDLLDNLQGMQTLKAFNTDEVRGQKLKKQAWGLHKAIMSNLSVSLIESGILQFGAAAGSVLSIGVGIYRAMAGYINLEDMVFILFLVTSCFVPVLSLISSWHTGFMGITAATSIIRIISGKNENIIFTNKESMSKPMQQDNTMICIKNVSFQYNEKLGDVLKNISITIKKGETVAIVGKSGSGKSTLAHLLAGFYKADTGEIQIANKNIADYEEYELHKILGVVWQDAFLFYGSVFENITMSKPDATMEEVIFAAKKAGIHDFIASLPNAYNTIAGERGMRLSGGEKQRIAIARCFLANPQFIIFDEATANLDGENEIKIQESIQLLMENKSSIIIAHRLSTIKNADQIYVLKDGEIVQHGSHNQLIEQEGEYKNLMHKQWGVTKDES